MTDPGAERDDPLRSMRAERVERDDGRYLVYFSWPAPGGERHAPSDPVSGDAPADAGEKG
ncbi:MAG TPA: hypothetical protein VHK06_02655 [Candidatus Limnocylindria bacterium]|nr:hypothetical protein [Candidatus Limnocylindria bacterium]